jgi:electron transfer flavoprotein beta subunit
VKQIQDPEIAPSVFKVDETKNAVVPVAGMALVMSPFDEQAVEAALRIKDKVPECSVTVVTMGPSSAREVLKHGLSMGADEGILLSNEGASNSDPYVTAAMLCGAIRKAGNFDLILTGRQSADLDAGIVGCGVAELLNIPAISFAKDVQTDGSSLTVERVLDTGVEVVEGSLPALVTISNELGAARKPSLRETMRAARKPVSTWSYDEVVNQKLEPKMEVVRLFVLKKDKRCVFIPGSSPEEIAANLAAKLREAELI